MKKYVFVGDIHGKVDAVEKALSLEGKKIFVGDFQDSWNKTPEQHAQCFRLVLDAIKAGEAEAIFGNHELSYMMPHHECSGKDYKRGQMFKEYEIEIRTHFKPFIRLEHNLLVTHAGLTSQLWEEMGLTFENLNQSLTEGWNDPSSPVHYIGYSRGGRTKYGGIFWCDFNEEFEPVKGLNQIFGHTRGDGIRCVQTDTESSWCIDGLDKNLEFLQMEVDE